MATDYNQLLRNQEKTAKARQEAFAESQSLSIGRYVDQMNQAYDTAARAMQEQTEASKQGVAGQYARLLDYNAVQQAVNEKKVAEAMANMGLTDAGLNRSQQTALALQRGNADADTRAARQAAVDALDQQINQYLAELEATKAQTAAGAWQSAQQNILQNEQALLDSARQSADAQYGALLEQQTALEQARLQSLGDRVEDKNAWEKEKKAFWQSQYKANLTVMNAADAAKLATEQTNKIYGASYGSGSGGGSIWNWVGNTLSGGTTSGGTAATGGGTTQAQNSKGVAENGLTYAENEQMLTARFRAGERVRAYDASTKAKMIVEEFLNGRITEEQMDNLLLVYNVQKEGDAYIRAAKK